MAKKILVNYDFSRNEVQNMRTHILAASPSNPLEALRYYDSVSKSEYFWNGTEWVPLDARLRTGIPISNLATNPLARANHTGTQTAATISDLAAVVKAYRHDEFAAPTAAIPMNGQKLTGLGAPTAGSNDAARIVDVENAVQSAAAGIDSKPSVRLVSVSNISSLTGLAAIDGVVPVANDRVLLTAQTTATQNGVYTVAAGAWSRATDADATGEITSGAFWFVEEGTAYSKSQWRCSNSGGITLGTTSITITQFGAAVIFTAGNGLTLTGNDFSVGAGTGIVVSADAVSIDTSVVARKFAVNVGDATSSAFAVNHGLNSLDVIVQVREASTGSVVDCDVQNTSVNVSTITFTPTVPTLNQYRVVCQG